MTAADDSLALLDDYLSSAMSATHAADFEERLFSLAALGPVSELAYLDAFFDHAHWFATRGGFLSGATAQIVADLRKLPGVHYIDVGTDTQVSAWPADTKIVAYRVAVDLRGYENIDVAIVTPEGQHRKWFRDCTYDPADGALYGVSDAPLAASSFRHEPLIARVVATRTTSATGKREIVAELRVTPR